MTNDAIMAAGMAQASRDQLRRQVLPFAQGCEHDIEALPVVDFCLDYTCTKCHGFGSFNWGILDYEDRQAFWSLEPSRQLALLMRRKAAGP